MSEPIGKTIRLLPGISEPIGRPHFEPNVVNEGNSKFSELLSDAINSVNELQHDSGKIQAEMMSGEPVELHQVMIKAEEAGLTMELLLEIRNRLVNGYNELVRMPM